MDAQVGDRIVVESSKVGGARRSGEIIDVIGGAAGQHYRVRWDDGHESTAFPSSDAFIERKSQNH
jgi:hypothetical protein